MSLPNYITTKYLMLKAVAYNNAVKVNNFKPRDKHEDSQSEDSFIIIIKWK